MSEFKILKIVSTEEQAFYHADIIVPTSEYYVNDVTSEGLSAFTYTELQQVHDNHITEYSALDKWSRDILEASVLNIMNKIEVDDTPIFKLRAKLKREPIAPSVVPLSDAQRDELLSSVKANVQGKQRVQALPRSTNMKRPGDATASGRIWAKCDLILKELCFMEVKDSVLKWGAEVGINVSTVRTQYGHWKRFNNL